MSLSTIAAILVCPCLAAPQGVFVRGDANRDFELSLSDAIHVLHHAFLGGETPECMDAADANDDGSITVADPVFVLNFLFLGKSQPSWPFPKAGKDGTEDSIDCDPPDAALSFEASAGADSSNQSATAPPSSTLNFASGFTFGTWLYLRDDPAGCNIYEKWEYAVEDFSVRIWNQEGLARRVRFRVFPLFWGFMSQSEIPLNTWTHIACTFGNGLARIYVNGVLEISMEVAGNARVGHGRVSIGAAPRIAGCVMNLDEISAWSRVLPPDEIKILKEGRIQDIPSDGLVQYFRCNEGAGQWLIDESGNQNDCQIGKSSGPDSGDPAWVGR